MDPIPRIGARRTVGIAHQPQEKPPNAETTGMDYHLRPLNPNPSITIVGCGGTGGFVAESLCRLFTGREADIVLVDHDRVEPHNLLRQNFTEENLGEYKSQALAERLTRTYRRTVGYSTRPFENISAGSWQDTYPGIKGHGQSMIIGCVDNARARKEMAQSIRRYTNTWLIDAGTGTTGDKYWWATPPSPGTSAGASRTVNASSCRSRQSRAPPFSPPPQRQSRT